MKTKFIIKIKDNKYKRVPIPRALREQIWIKHNKNKFEVKCPIKWCRNKINCFNFHSGHNVPSSKGGATNIRNLTPICPKCNLSMSNNYTIKQFSKKFS